MLIVGDDISLPDNKQPRGIAGTILVHKVAGYFAERGFNLATVLREAQYAANHTASIGVALASCHLPQEAESAPRHQPATPSWGWASTASRELRRSRPITARKSCRLW